MPPNDRRYLILLLHVSLARPATNGANPFARCLKISRSTIIADHSFNVEIYFGYLRNKLAKFFANVYYVMLYLYEDYSRHNLFSSHM